MLNIIMKMALGCFACVGFVQMISWLIVRSHKRNQRIYRVLPIGGEGNNPGQQMSLMYACLQWEANPAGMQTVLYDVGMSKEDAKECELLAKSTGVRLLCSPQELEILLRGSP